VFRKTFGAVVVAALLVTAGCAGSVPAGPATTDGTDTARDGTGESGSTGESGTVAFYVSDQPNAIGDFEHLNVTITRIGLHRTGDLENGTATNATATATNETTTTSSTDDDDAADDDADDDRAGDGEWIEHEVDRRTVDLTELTGANASRLGVLDAPAGTYDRAFIYVDDIDATLTTGEQVRVKLPSERLHVNRAFTVGDGEAVDFVFDISPHRAGNSGKYILRPVVSQSGTGEEVDIRERDGRDDDDDALRARFVGPVERGANATVRVTGPDGPVEGATVRVGDSVVGETSANGTRTFAVPADAEELEVTVTAGDAETELEVEFDERDGDDAEAGSETDDTADESDDTADDGGGPPVDAGR
jgi:hypothetical protein